MNFTIEFNKKMFIYFCKHNKELMNGGFTQPQKLKIIQKNKKISKQKENLKPRISLLSSKFNKYVNKENHSTKDKFSCKLKTSELSAC